MKKLLLLSIIFLLFSCKETEVQKVQLKGDKNISQKIILKPKYKKFRKGDIVFVKPDSLRVTIVCVNENNTYDIKYFIAGEEQFVAYVEPHNFFNSEN